MKPKYILDASAVMAYLEKDKDYRKVIDLLTQAGAGTARLLMSAPNWGEVLYAVENAYGKTHRDKVEEILDEHPIDLVPADKDLSRRAAGLKSKHKLPYLDCFCAALTLREKASLLTADRDFERVEKEIQIVWI